jgi:hypothetical protein
MKKGIVQEINRIFPLVIIKSDFRILTVRVVLLWGNKDFLFLCYGKAIKYERFAVIILSLKSFSMYIHLDLFTSFLRYNIKTLRTCKGFVPRNNRK